MQNANQGGSEFDMLNRESQSSSVKRHAKNIPVEKLYSILKIEKNAGKKLK